MNTENISVDSMMDVRTATEIFCDIGSIIIDNCTCNGSIQNNTCTNVTASIGYAPPNPLWLTVLLGLMASIVILVTICGNILVLLSFALERNIRQPTNYFIASLAVSDLLIGTFSMPCFTLYLLLGYWPLGEMLCDLWLSLDWTVCLASQYTVFFITVDRFFSVKLPAKYRNWRTERRVVIMVAFTWIIPSAVFFISIIGWQYFVGKRTVPEGTCEVQFMGDPLFTFLLTIGYYWTTLAVMIGLYAGIYRVALSLQKKSEAKHKRLTTAMGLSKGKNKSKKNNKSVKSPVIDDTVVQNNTQNQKHIDTTSFTKHAEEDRSSSPAFASDDENSDSHEAYGNGKSNNKSKHKHDEIDDEQTCFVNSAVQTDTTYRPSLKGMLGQSFNHVSKIALSITAPTSSDDDKEKSDTAERQSEEINNYHNKVLHIENTPKSTDALLENEILQGCKYIDEESLKSLASSENIRLLSEPMIEYASSTDDGGNSPVWKKRKDKYLPIPIPEEFSTSVSIIDSGVDMHDEHDQTGTNTNTTLSPLPANGKSWNNAVSLVKQQNSVQKLSTVETEDKPHKFGSPFHALVKSIRAKQKQREREKQKTESRKSKSENRARKALRTISFILGAYVLCWTPYHVIVFIIGVCGAFSCVNATLYNICYWLCYLNSPVNPFCYAFANQQFKRTFLRLLRLDFHKT
ncbi:muscarinic acetylcholine receptor M2-like [Mytilus californianus]|uniref:muscarinic acetylcholine receptor M2-like n=1 Tax=Mytilus californianus TaxID=6549 RepID=UPI002245CA18|nr:muscarinic acetylcholine receptor M2-like [Mytilus californianus]XP_052094670.1 muscarinic acetylcholine receptor M2-like [Mytilus californianus]